MSSTTERPIIDDLLSTFAQIQVGVLNLCVQLGRLREENAGVAEAKDNHTPINQTEIQDQISALVDPILEIVSEAQGKCQGIVRDLSDAVSNPETCEVDLKTDLRLLGNALRDLPRTRASKQLEQQIVAVALRLHGRGMQLEDGNGKADLQRLLDDATWCQMALAEMRRDFLRLEDIEENMEDVNFANNRDESNYRRIRERVDTSIESVLEHLDRILRYGRQRGLDVEEAPSSPNAFNEDQCWWYELSVRTVANLIQVELAKQTGDATRPGSKSKKSTPKGGARTKLIAGLTTHHGYCNGSVRNTEPIGNNQLARDADVRQSVASEFFKDKFGGHSKYKWICGDPSNLIASLKLLNDEFIPSILSGAKPLDEGIEAPS